MYNERCHGFLRVAYVQFKFKAPDNEARATTRAYGAQRETVDLLFRLLVPLPRVYPEP